MLSGAVVLEPRRIRAALEIILRRVSFGEEPAHRLELIGPVEVGGARNRELGVVEVRSQVSERKCLDRLGGAAEQCQKFGVASRGDHLATRYRDGVYPMARFDHVAAHDVNLDQPHARSLRKG